ncbi:MAG: hypothetical protein CTY33_03755 [Methylotenera sp.]|nr:MAG: hypothetical protein CTY33_03755 [Methylotenera sp.]
MDWRAAIVAGVMAGIVFMMVEMLMVLFFMDQSPWGPPRMMAAMVLGKDVLPPPADFDTGVMMTAMMIHLPLSILYGLILSYIAGRFNTIKLYVAGALLGLAIYWINFYIIAPVAFPWFTEAQNWISLVSHLVFGVVLGGAYAKLRHSSVQARS